MQAKFSAAVTLCSTYTVRIVFSAEPGIDSTIFPDSGIYIVLREGLFLTTDHRFRGQS